jgi:mycothiol synthase
MGIQIESIDTLTAPNSVLRDLADYYDVIEAEERPGDPPTPRPMQYADWRNLLPLQPVKRWVVRDGGQVVAAAVAAYDLEQNLENGFGRLHVHPEHRGRGHARRIAGPLFDELEGAGRTRVDTYIKNDAPAEDLAARLGMKAVYEEKRSRLRIDDLDHDLMRSWIERASERGSEYRVEYFRSPIPDEMIEQYCDLALVMNTAPREDFEEEDEVLTPQMWRDLEKSAADSKSQIHVMIAIHEPTGDYAGYTTMKTQDLQPDLAWQWDTGIHPEHRNKGLGRWVKAAMIEKVVVDYPAVARLDTYNAGSNEPMLNINVAMGFRTLLLTRIWQGDLATARQRFDV